MSGNGDRVWRCSAAVGVLLALAAGAWAQDVQETKEQRDARMAWWREAKFGMFIHWGVYAVPAGVYKDKQIGGIGEWIMHGARIPTADYRAFAQQFNPVKYDPQAWAQLAKRAGMKYMVITSKHHDGFTLFPSEASDWGIGKASPYGKDLIGPLAAAARKQGLKFGLYYSQDQDWNNPGGSKAGLADGQGWDEAQKGSFDEYLRKVSVPQVREILTRYQPDVLWWDTPCLMNAERARPLYELLSLRPGIIHNNRLGGGYKGDTETPEQHIPATGYKGRDWETCMTMNDTWGYKSYDNNWKSTEVLVRNLIDIVSKGGNYLLNVGPTAEGEFPQPSIDRLNEVGRWMDVNGEAIYGTRASPFKKQLAWGRCTQKDDKLYLHVFNWPADGRLAVPLKNEVKRARLLADKSKLKLERAAEATTILLPAAAPDKLASVIVLEIEGAPEPADSAAAVVTPDAQGQLLLKAAEANLVGETLQLEEKGGAPNLGYWTQQADYPEWVAQVPAGAYAVIVEYALEGGPTTFAVECGAARSEGELAGTQDWGTFATKPAGTLTVGVSGKTTIRVKAVKMNYAAMNLRGVTLKPIAQ